MKAILVVLLLTFSMAMPGLAWEKTYGGTGIDGAYSIAPTLDGGYIVAGYTTSFGTGSYDAWIIKLNLEGDTAWTRTYGGRGWDFAYCIVPAVDGGYIVAGRTKSNITWLDCPWILKLDVNGDTLWTHMYDGPGGGEAQSIITTPDGGYVAAGFIVDDMSNISNVWILKLNCDGDTLWTRFYGGIFSACAYSISPTPDSGYIVAGHTSFIRGGSSAAYILKLDANGDTIWTHAYSGVGDDVAYSITPAVDGGYIVAGSSYVLSTGQDDAWIVRIEREAGETLWTRTYGGVNDDFAYHIATTPDGGYIVAGSTESFGAGSYDAWVLKLNLGGDTLWTRTYGGINPDFANSIACTPDGGYIIAGYTTSSESGGADVYVIKLDSLGNSSDVASPASPPDLNHLSASTHTDILNLRITLQRTTALHLDLLNLAGDTVLPIADREFPQGETQLSLGIGNLPAGVYLVQSNGTLPTARVIVLR